VPFVAQWRILRSVKNVRVKTKTYAQRAGDSQRKSILLRKKYHNLYHSGKLSKDGIKKLSLYKGKAVNHKKKC